MKKKPTHFFMLSFTAISSGVSAWAPQQVNYQMQHWAPYPN